jgi:hypothetical protein
LPENNAMNQFITSHQQNIIGVLSGWDRIRFRGTLRLLSAVNGLMAWLSDRRVRLTDFKPFAMDLTATLKASVERIAGKAGRTIQYLASSALSKEALVAELLRREKIAEGLVCVLSCTEPCWSFEIHRDREKKTIDPVRRLRKCLHWYVYFLDRQLGLCHVRIQSWLPFTVHVCVNGREQLCRQLDRAGLAYVRSDNCLIRVADVAAAQKRLDAQPWLDWTGILNRLLQRACPALCRLPMREGTLSHYWSADETEWATDVLFRTPAALAELYPSLLRHAMTTFSSREVMRFLGRTRMPLRGGVDLRFEGEVMSHLGERPEGVRIKHRMNRNSVKMYDKQGSVLRVETTINDARDLGVYRASESDPKGKKTWRRLRKGVVDLPRRGAISQAANLRYLAALSGVEGTTALGQVADDVSRPVIRDGRRCRGLNPMTGDDARLADVLLRGEFSLNGFRNRDVRTRLFPDSPDRHTIRRQAAKVTRLLRLHRAHGLIRKLNGTQRYQLTAKGRQTLPAFSAARKASTQKLNELVA